MNKIEIYKKYIKIEEQLKRDCSQSEKIKLAKQKIIDCYMVCDFIYYSNIPKKKDRIKNIFMIFGKTEKNFKYYLKQKKLEEKGINIIPNIFYKMQDEAKKEMRLVDINKDVEYMEEERNNPDNLFINYLMKKNKILIDKFYSLKGKKYKTSYEYKKVNLYKDKLKNIFEKFKL